MYNKLIKVLIHPFISYLWSIYYMPAMVLGLRTVYESGAASTLLSPAVKIGKTKSVL